MPGDCYVSECLCSSRAGQKLPTDQNASQNQKYFVDVGAFLVADTQSSKLVEPGKAPLYHPSPAPEATTVVSVTHCKKRPNPAFMQTLPNPPRIITAVTYNAIRPVAWTPLPSLQWWNGVNKRQCLLTIIKVSPVS